MASKPRRICWASSGHILPCALYQSQLQSYSFHWNEMPCFAPTASMTRTPSGITSRPMPSPGITAILCSVINISITNAPMKFAAFETSTEWCSVAVWIDGGLAGIEERAGIAHSARLLPMLDRLLAAAGVSIAQLDAVAFGAGPGSFTGLRIACGVAQGLAFARGLPVIGVSTLEAMAEESGEARVVACLDARMHEVYYSAIEKAGCRWREIIPAQCVAPAAVKVPPGEGWVGCGNGFVAYGSMGLDRVIPDIHPSAIAVARLAAPRFEAGEGLDAGLAVPVYVRDKVAFTIEERNSR